MRLSKAEERAEGQPINPFRVVREGLRDGHLSRRLNLPDQGQGSLSGAASKMQKGR